MTTGLPTQTNNSTPSTPPSSLAAALESLFPSAVVFEVASQTMWKAPLFPQEEALIARAVAKRQSEFRAGRACARKALAHAGAPSNIPILAADDRLPLWPVGFVGSISHCNDLCAAAVAPSSAVQSLGLDVEPREPLPHGTANLIVANSEKFPDSLTAALGKGVLMRLIFSAKESLYKCAYPIIKSTFEFLDLQINLKIDGQKNWINGSYSANPTARASHALQILTRLKGRFAVTENHLFTSAVWPQPS